jgi:hypothetical protein
MEEITMLWQLHHQYPDGHTEFVAQTSDYAVRLNTWILRAKREYPLPAGTTWLMCNEEAGEFVRQRKADPL